MRTTLFLVSVIAFFLYLVTDHAQFAVVAVFNIVLSAQSEILYAIRKSKEDE